MWTSHSNFDELIIINSLLNRNKRTYWSKKKKYIFQNYNFIEFFSWFSWFLWRRWKIIAKFRFGKKSRKEPSISIEVHEVWQFIVPGSSSICRYECWIEGPMYESINEKTKTAKLKNFEAYLSNRPTVKGVCKSSQLGFPDKTRPIVYCVVHCLAPFHLERCSDVWKRDNKNIEV